MFLMATSAIGPGFITQTTVFTAQLGAAFAFAIVISIIVDIAVQLNVWRVIGVSGMRAQELANQVLPGAGYVLAALVFLGGAVFNIGNIAGTGLGLNAMLGMDPKLGGAISAVIAIGLAWAMGQSMRLSRAEWRTVIVFGLCQNALYLGLNWVGMQWVEASAASITSRSTSRTPRFVSRTMGGSA